MKKSYLILIFYFIVLHSFAQIPQEKLVFWFSADSVELVSNKVRTLYDRSSNQNNFVQATATNQPTIVTSNVFNKPIIRFNGTSNYFQNNLIMPVTGKISIFAIYKTNGTGDRFLLAQNGTGWLYDFSATQIRINNGTVVYTKNHPMSTFILSSAIMSSEGSRHYENMISKASSTTAVNPSISNLSIGLNSSYSRYFIGDLAEILIYDSVFSNQDRQQIETFLMNKYAPPVNLGENIQVEYGFCHTINTAKKNFYTNYLWSNGNTNDTIIISKTGAYSVTVTDIFGRQSTDTIHVGFTPFNQLTDTTFCYGNSVVWNTDVSNENYNFQWLGSAETTNSLTISQTGNYAVIITDTNQCKFYSDTISFIANDYEHTASIGPQDTAFCYGNRLMLISNTDETVNYQWSGASTSSPFASEITITESGLYTVTVTNNIGCIAIDTINVSIAGYAPTTQFSAEGLCEKNQIVFTDQSVENGSPITFWQWKINEQEISNEQNFDIIFQSAATYNINLYTENSIGCNNFFNQNITIHPLPKIKFSPDYFCQNYNIQLVALSTIENDNIIKNIWKINNETFACDSVSYIFENEGFNTIKLISETDFTCKDSLTVEKFVRNATKPEFHIENNCLNSDTYFINTTGYNSINLPQYFIWSFDNLQDTLYSSSPVMVFDSAGNYTVKLKIRYSNNCESETEQNFEIVHLPEIQLLDTVSCVNTVFSPEYTEFSQSGEIVSHYWKIEGEFLTSEINNEANPNIFFTTSGSYAITLQVTTNLGCSTTIYDTLKIVDSPKAYFSTLDSIGIAPYSVQFQNNSQAANFYEWNFGNDNISNIENPTYTFLEDGTYSVKLKAINEFGCEDNTSKIIKVVEPNLDLILYNIRTEIRYDFLKINVYVINNSNLNLENIELVLDVGNGRIFKENISFLHIGEVIDYCFNSQIYIPNFDNLNYISIDAECLLTKNYGDKDITNNRLIVFFNDNILIYSPYPNPTKDDINFQIVSNKNIDIQLFIFDYKGNIIKSEEIQNVKGIITHSINTTSLSTGSYILTVIANREKNSFKFEILKN